MRRYPVALAAACLAAACGNGGPGPSDGEAPADTLEVAVVDTVGVMMGDSAYVFGNITDASLSDDGMLYVLDGLRCRLGIYSSEGEHIEFVGRKGSGPGEYQYPRSFALMDDGSIAVCDWGGISVTHLTPQFEVDTVLTGYRHIAPDRIAPMPDGGYVGMSLTHRVEDGGPAGENFVARFGRSEEPEVVYCSYPMRFTQAPDGDLNVHTAALTWDTGPDGSVWTAAVSDSIWAFTGYTASGDTITTVSRPWEKAEKTEEELAEGYEHESLSTSTESGNEVRRDRRYQGIPRFHNAITDIAVDGQGRIWVASGHTEVPTFDVYDPRGQRLFAARIPELDNSDGLEYCFDHGMIGFDTQPEDYPKVYMLEIVESE